MNFSPEDRVLVLDLAAEKLVARMCAICDVADLLTLPIDAVVQILGITPAQVRRQFTTRPMGKRKLGVSLKAIQDYQRKNVN